ncbi:hypothetical protein APR11_001475 [Nocardia amikacinitolerans]|nr:hypothetical protein [Nocardia amikacinitolerans]
MVLDEVWRKLDGVEALSGPQGGPLRRTVKLVLDPLVIRPVQHPSCAGAILTADGATLLATRIYAAADVLRATAAWFTLLKQVRRALRITEGNPQDLYFQRCFELATTAGHPDPVRDKQTAEAALRDIHEFAAGRTTQALKEHLTDVEVARELGGLIEIAWRRRPSAVRGDHTAGFEKLLDACANSRVTGDGQPELDRLVAAHAGTHSGIDLWHRASGGSANELGLTAHPLPHPPALGTSASKADLGLPFDRTIYERVFTVLQASSERAELPPIPELVTDEIARSCAPWALLDETLRVAAATGAALAVGLSPFGVVSGESVGVGRVRHLADAGRTDRGGTAGNAQSGTGATDAGRAALDSVAPGNRGSAVHIPHADRSDGASSALGDRGDTAEVGRSNRSGAADVLRPDHGGAGEVRQTDRGGAAGAARADRVGAAEGAAVERGSAANLARPGRGGAAGAVQADRVSAAEAAPAERGSAANLTRPDRSGAADADRLSAADGARPRRDDTADTTWAARRAAAPYGVARETAAHQAINNRWRREAYVLQARRLAVHEAEEASGPLAQIAAELRTPWRPYLRRLWVRLHGRDVRAVPVGEPEELWDLLDGVARSVILDHRTKVKNALSASAVAGEFGSTESRAS